MAFNPFTTFQKNQKFWMATILMVCMVTFVFCTGSRGDVSDFIMKILRRSTGSTVVTIAGHSYSSFDLSMLRDQRNIVNDFMRACSDITIHNINDTLHKLQEMPIPTEEKKKQERSQLITELNRVKMVLLDRMRQPRYFEGGVKLDDLIEFKLWDALADKLSIRMQPEDVDFLVRSEFFSPRNEHLSFQQLFEAEAMARRGKDLPSGGMHTAIMAEFRVRFARLAYQEMRPGYLGGMPVPGIGTEQRVPVTLAQLWKVYQDKRSEFDVTLIPIHVADFTKDIKDTPTDAELEKLFAKYKSYKYDPDSPLPSFETPSEIRVEFIMADPTSPIYIAAARAKTILQRAMPIGGSPFQSPLIAAARMGAVAAAGQKDLLDIVEGLSQKKYDDFGGADLSAGDFYWPMAAHLASREPRAIANLVANIPVSVGVPALPGAASWASFLAVPALNEMARLEAGLSEESKRRLLPSAKVAAAGLSGQPLGVIAAAVIELKQQTPPHPLLPRAGRTLLPLPIIEPELEQVLENHTAELWASRNLMTVKRLLDRSNLKPAAIEQVINKAERNYNLRHETTKKLYSRYNIDQAPELQPLREAYERYFREINWFEKRDLTPERLLKENEFYKLFFETERFAANGATFQVRPWPPDIYPSQMQVLGLPGPNQMEQPNVAPELMVDMQKFMQQGAHQTEGFRLLDKAQKPILFWRNEQKSSEFPKDLASAKPRVIAAYQTEQAREEKALPLAKKIAEDLKQTGGEFPPDVRNKAAQEGGRREIVLQKIAPLVPKTVGEILQGGHRDYFPYRLPKDTIGQARDDMVSQLLNLYEPKSAIEIKTGLTGGEPAFVKQLNDINKSLFDAIKKEKDPKGKYVQVLTNKPQTIYYVACITRPPTADPKDFQDFVLKFASETPLRSVDTFVARAQELRAKEFHAALIAQLREDLGFSSTGELDETRKSFDRDDHGG
jgi:hypothetical protein